MGPLKAPLLLEFCLLTGPQTSPQGRGEGSAGEGSQVVATSPRPLPQLESEERMGCGPPGSSVHGVLQAGILERAAEQSSGGPSRPTRDRTLVSGVSHIGRWALYQNRHLGSLGQTCLQRRSGHPGSDTCILCTLTTCWEEPHSIFSWDLYIFMFVFFSFPVLVTYFFLRG